MNRQVINTSKAENTLFIYLFIYLLGLLEQ